ncbi:ANTAR domain-containing protein [Amycolatopsis sp. lyj-112]|uniref:ANTAR domain-containing protein n=1 Tax=Amycolatopsis sp. lyj-112 TaxID=2789288 RepID=UPI00397C29BB
MRKFVEAETGREARAAAVAQRHEGLVDTAGEPMRAFHLRMAELHRATERQHRAAAELHAAHADALSLWTERQRYTRTLPPKFMAAVATATGSPSMAMTLLGLKRDEAAVAVSDSVAEAAHDLEYVFGEGPAQTALDASGTLNVCGEEELSRQWPQFGPALYGLGVHAVVSARLGRPEAPLGALTAYRPDAASDLVVTSSVATVAGALTATALDLSVAVDAEDGLPAHPLFDDVDLRAVVHQATGMVMTLQECSASDALALLRAHAFARNKTVTEVAVAIVNRTARFS